MKTSKIRACRRGIPSKHVAQALVFLNGQRGFTLIELMIGLALGLIASLAIFTTISSFETQRNTTASGADMQQNGLMALYSIEQDVRMAGFGLIDASTTPGSMPCSKINAYNPASVYNSAPVSITNNASAGNDILIVTRLNSDTGGIVTGGNAAGLNQPLSAGTIPASIQMNTIESLQQDDYILLAQPGFDCTLLKVSARPSATIGASGVDVVQVGNASGDTSLSPAAFPAYGSAASAVVVNLGLARTASATTFGSTDQTLTPTFATTKYRINPNSYDLERSEDGGSTWSSVATNIVTIAAQYGITNTGSPSVSCWTDASGSACSGTNWASPSSADIARIKAIRVAIVARSAQKVGASGSCSTTTAAPISWTGGPAIDLSGITDWQCYRYKVYQTIIPIRNVIWGNL